MHAAYCNITDRSRWMHLGHEQIEHPSFVRTAEETHVQIPGSAGARWSLFDSWVQCCCGLGFILFNLQFTNAVWTPPQTKHVNMFEGHSFGSYLRSENETASIVHDGKQFLDTYLRLTGMSLRLENLARKPCFWNHACSGIVVLTVFWNFFKESHVESLPYLLDSQSPLKMKSYPEIGFWLEGWGIMNGLWGQKSTFLGEYSVDVLFVTFKECDMCKLQRLGVCKVYIYEYSLGFQRQLKNRRSVTGLDFWIVGSMNEPMHHLIRIPWPSHRIVTMTRFQNWMEEKKHDSTCMILWKKSTIVLDSITSVEALWHLVLQTRDTRILVMTLCTVPCNMQCILYM